MIVELVRKFMMNKGKAHIQNVSGRLLASLALFLFLVTGCAVDITSVNLSTVPEVDLTCGGEYVRVNDFSLVDINFCGNCFVGKLHRMPYHYMLFDSDFNPTDSILRVGRGPEEFIAPLYCGMQTAHMNGDSFYVLDRPSKEFFKVTLNGSRISFEKLFTKIALEGMHDIRFCFPLANDKFLIQEDNGACEWTVWENGELIRKFGIPSAGKKQNESANPYQTANLVKPDMTRVASACFLLPRLDIYDMESGDVVKTMLFDKSRHSCRGSDEEPVDWFLKLAGDDESIYCLFKGPDCPDNQARVIQVDWNGDVIRTLIVPDAISFTADEDNLYVMVQNDEGGGVIRYRK